ncbi:diguanylate cyclase [Pseudoxanthomonas sp. PXM02]|uniref:sensor domain-containing diguanylate cyclase n=1 Tax=Pseudoxanthomonas sp. PXM02 TaxID=2769294 RepID=UPI00177B6398|nr:diguanylate cyclase [Pseudoxanthomonas sp. PXM02]MBD9477764.1 diguanylate cyclase [Pseudoxanthomonas sp. PXM02]
MPTHAKTLSLARLTADAPAQQVVSGGRDADFAVARDGVIFEPDTAPRWWRVTSPVDVDAALQPHLVVRAPYQNRIELWTGHGQPIVRGLFGENADLAFSARALAFPLPDGLRAGQPLYLRVTSIGGTPMPLSIQPLREVHRQDLEHVAWRAMVLGAMGVLAVLALGFCVGLGERSYGFLALTLLSQALFLALAGGELRSFEVFGHVLGSDPRMSRVAGMLAVIASNTFLAFYLDLAQRGPVILRVLRVCNLLLAGLVLASLVSTSTLVAKIGNVVLLVATASVLLASVRGTLRNERPAFFLLLSWLPMMLLTAARVGELLGWWVGPPWMIHAFPLGFALAGLVLTVGLADRMQQLRRDRDHASRLAAHDTLTGLLSRTAIIEQLQREVELAHAEGSPLSVVFFDIDHFKRINDEHGHPVGDQSLRLVATRTRGKLRKRDFLGRYGGDEMLVILPDTTFDNALIVAEHLRAAVNNRPLTIDGRVIDTSLSLGVAQLASGETFERLLERVDVALYSSKSAGRDRVTGDLFPQPGDA